MVFSHASTMAILLVDFKRKISSFMGKPLQVSRNEDYMIDNVRTDVK